MPTRPLVNITMPTCNRLECTRQALEALHRHTRPGFHLCVVDNASTDGTQDYLRSLYAKGLIHTLYLLDRNMGVACAVNTGWDAVQADMYMKLDNDIVVQRDGWLKPLMVLATSTPSLAMMAYPAQSYPEALPLQLPGGPEVLQVPFCGGQCVIIPHRTRETLGYWCEDYGLYGEEDSDYGIRIACAKLGSVVLPDYAAVATMDSTSATPYNEVKLRAARRKNIEQYLTNAWAYRTGLRPLFMSRKYTQIVDGHTVVFGLDKTYRDESAAWNAHKKNVAATNKGWIEEYIAGRR